MKGDEEWAGPSRAPLQPGCDLGLPQEPQCVLSEGDQEGRLQE